MIRTNDCRISVNVSMNKILQHSIHCSGTITHNRQHRYVSALPCLNRTHCSDPTVNCRNLWYRGNKVCSHLEHCSLMSTLYRYRSERYCSHAERIMMCSQTKISTYSDIHPFKSEHITGRSNTNKRSGMVIIFSPDELPWSATTIRQMRVECVVLSTPSLHHKVKSDGSTIMSCHYNMSSQPYWDCLQRGILSGTT